MGMTSRGVIIRLSNRAIPGSWAAITSNVIDLVLGREHRIQQYEELRNAHFLNPVGSLLNLDGNHSHNEIQYSFSLPKGQPFSGSAS